MTAAFCELPERGRAEEVGRFRSFCVIAAFRSVPFRSALFAEETSGDETKTRGRRRGGMEEQATPTKDQTNGTDRVCVEDGGDRWHVRVHGVCVLGV